MATSPCPSTRTRGTRLPEQTRVPVQPPPRSFRRPFHCVQPLALEIRICKQGPAAELSEPRGRRGHLRDGQGGCGRGRKAELSRSANAIWPVNGPASWQRCSAAAATDGSGRSCGSWPVPSRVCRWTAREVNDKKAVSETCRLEKVGRCGGSAWVNYGTLAARRQRPAHLRAHTTVFPAPQASVPTAGGFRGLSYGDAPSATDSGRDGANPGRVVGGKSLPSQLRGANLTRWRPIQGPTVPIWESSDKRPTSGGQPADCTRN
jgi:hypothetical protein